MDLFLWVGAALLLGMGWTVFTGAPFVPTQMKYVRRAFEEIYPLDTHEVVVDLGAGDGRVLQYALEKGAVARGVEIHPLLALWARMRAPRAEVHCGSMWRYALTSDVTVVYLFLDSRDSKKFVQYLKKNWKHDHPIHIMSYGIQLPGLHEVARAAGHRLYIYNAAQEVL